MSITTPTANTRSRLISEAQVLLQTRGYDGFSYQDLADRVGIRKASIFHHFSSKADLGAAVLARYREEFAIWRSRRENLPPVERIASYFRLFGRFAAADKACPVAMAESDFFSLSEPMREQALELARAHLEWLTDTLEKGRATGAFRFEGAPRHQAEVIGCIIQGALLSSRLWGTGQLDNVFRQTLRGLGVTGKSES
ncbi:MAG: TetR/AcrR family transcriptional regulator [Nitrospirota bacterium]|nr:TetR/AcrR family transcriptional regulator [Nitrospirota bacterium]